MRGFQVAPAGLCSLHLENSNSFFKFVRLEPELEGHLLDHKFVVDVCVVPYPDDYSGEVPLAFVVPHASLAKELRHSDEEAKLKAELIKVG